MYLRPPAVVAKEVATVDVLSGGRVILGVGAGGGKRLPRPRNGMQKLSRSVIGHLVLHAAAPITGTR